MSLLGVGGLTGCEASDLAEFGDIYFIKLTSDAAEVASAATELSAEFGFEPIHIYDAASEGFSVRIPLDISEDLEAIDIVDYVTRDEGDEALPPEEIPEEITIGADEIPTGIAYIGGPITGVSWSFAVAVIDTGIDATHPDLNVVGERDIVCDSTPSDCADGSDPQGHGTHVAGTIGALVDDAGVVGVAPGVPLHAVRVLDSSGSGYWSDIMAGVEYILDHNADPANTPIRVVNMSLGGSAGTGLDAEMEEALIRLEDAGVVMAIAAGNESQDVANVVPAGLDRGLVVSAYDVGAQEFAWFSNFGGEVDLAAPGVAIESTWPGGGYATLDGTSMASPHVAGAAAAYLALNNNADWPAVRDALTGTATDGYSGQGADHAEPMLDMSGW